MKRQYIHHRFTKDTSKRLEMICEILEDYVSQGYKLTLRQLYYQLVSRDVIANDQKEYSRLSRILTKARMAGIVDWDAIEDRLRKPQLPYWVHGVKDALNDTISQYRINRQEGQPNYIEVWVEKDALSQVLGRVTKEYHIRLMVNRGYSSCSAMRVSAERFIRQSTRMNQACHILYLGDHDPSGLDMVRDIEDRLVGFGCDDLTVHHIALTTEQVKQYSPPPNPAKMKDPRSGDYLRRHGRISWELDALEPSVLDALLRDHIGNLIDLDSYTNILEEEKLQKAKIKEFADSYKG